MATMTTLPMTIEELSRAICAPIVVTDDPSFITRWHGGWSLAYKRVDVFHWNDCGCDECGAYKRVGIG